LESHRVLQPGLNGIWRPPRLAAPELHPGMPMQK
jgi:hypothetical protein